MSAGAPEAIETSGDPAEAVPADLAQAHVAWTAELDRLEVELLWTERLLKVAEPLDREGWAPREEIPALPPHLEGRARALLARQTQVRLELMGAMRLLMRGRTYDAASTHTDDRPRYVDLVS